MVVCLKNICCIEILKSLHLDCVQCEFGIEHDYTEHGDIIIQIDSIFVSLAEDLRNIEFLPIPCFLRVYLSNVCRANINTMKLFDISNQLSRSLLLCTVMKRNINVLISSLNYLVDGEKCSLSLIIKKCENCFRISYKKTKNNNERYGRFRVE